MSQQIHNAEGCAWPQAWQLSIAHEAAHIFSMQPVNVLVRANFLHQVIFVCCKLWRQWQLQQDAINRVGIIQLLKAALESLEAGIVRQM
jgi:hypothetical protein